MSTYPRLIVTGFIDDGATAIETDATVLSPTGVTVTLTTAYQRPPLGDWPIGWPPALSYVGSPLGPDVPGYVFPSGTTVTFAASEAAALISAGAAVAA